MSHAKLCLFLCSLDNFLLKIAIVFSFGNQISKWRSFEKELFLTYFKFVFLITRERHKKSFSTYPTYIGLHTRILLFLLTVFCLPNFAKLANLSYRPLWLLFSVTPSVYSFLRHFEAINK